MVATIKVSIYNNKTKRNYGGFFETKKDCDEWIALCKRKKSWGELSDLKITIDDEQSDPEWRREVVKAHRRKNYPGFKEVAEALIEDKEGRPQKLQDVMAKRKAVKEKYPLS